MMRTSLATCSAISRPMVSTSFVTSSLLLPRIVATSPGENPSTDIKRKAWREIGVSASSFFSAGERAPRAALPPSATFPERHVRKKH